MQSNYTIDRSRLFSTASGLSVPVYETCVMKDAELERLFPAGASLSPW